MANPTKRVVLMGCTYAIGGLVYGYDTGNVLSSYTRLLFIMIRTNFGVSSNGQFQAVIRCFQSQDQYLQLPHNQVRINRRHGKKPPSNKRLLVANQCSS